MAELSYGHRTGTGKGKEYKVAADQYIHRRGGKVVYLSTAGEVTMCGSDATYAMGWAVPPKDASGYNAWKSSSTAGADKIFVITGIDDEYEMPVHSAITITATYIGMGAAAVLSGSTYSQVQYARMGTAASPLVVTGVDVAKNTVLVKIKPAKKQAL